MVPTITVDGLGGVGKGIVSLKLASTLSWNYLDSGIFYRLLALIASQKNISLKDETALARLATSISPEFEMYKTSNNTVKLAVIWEDNEISALLRTETCALKAAQISIYPAVRTALIASQRQFRKSPGLVADGRDMGSIVFSDALCKFLLTASLDVRIKRRCIQLKQQKNYVSFMETKNAIAQRDKVDQIQLAPMLDASSSVCVIDTSYLSVAEVIAVIAKKLSTLGLYFN